MTGVALFVVSLFVLIGANTAVAQDAKQLVQQAVHTELNADRTDHSKWLYYEVDRKPRNSVTQWVAETDKGNLARVLKKGGQTFSTDQQREAMEQFIQDTGAQAKQRADDKHDDAQAAEMVKLLPDAFLWTQTGTNGNNITLHFKPDPDFHAPNREAKVFSAMEGDMEVDTASHRIASIKGRMVHDVKFGFGLLGRLKAGGTFDVERRETGHGVWQITTTHVHVHGRALLFKSISEQEDDVKSQFEELPGDISLQQAEKKLLAKGGSDKQ